MIEIRYGLSINENHIDGIEQAARLNEDGKLYAATVFHMAGGREFVIEREEYQKVKHHFEPLSREEQWAKWDAEEKERAQSARMEMSHYIPEMNPADPFPPAIPAPVLPENVIKAWEEFDDASIEYELRDEPEDAALLEKADYTRSMFLTHFGDYMDEMRRKNAPTDPIEPTHFAF
jgi:hypothetical protein